VSALCFLSAIMRGDLICASNLTGILIVACLIFGLVAVMFLIGGSLDRIVIDIKQRKRQREC
jgi:hypothetical protein